MKKETFKRYMLLITYAIVLVAVLINWRSVLNGAGSLFKLLTPLWIGIGLAITLNVPMSIIEKKVFGATNKKVRVVSLILSIMIIVLLLLVLFVWIIPDFIKSASYLVGQIPSLLDSLNKFLIDTFSGTELSSYLNDFSGSSEMTNILSGVIKSLVTNFSSMLSNFATFVVDLVTGIIIAVYFLLEKEHILGTIKNLIKRIAPKDKVVKMKEVYDLSNKSIHDFITYQCLECLIIGVMMFIALKIFRFPYALTIAFLTTITAIIPIFGATIACIIGAILIGTSSINQSIVFLVVFQVVQQIEGNIIYPKVVGKHVGLPPVITIIALMIGGKIAGFLGMLLCIPLTSILYSLFWTKFKIDDSEIRKSSKKGRNKREAV